jgi:hypothetical protein
VGWRSGLLPTRQSNPNLTPLHDHKHAGRCGGLEEWIAANTPDDAVVAVVGHSCFLFHALGRWLVSVHPPTPSLPVPNRKYPPAACLAMPSTNSANITNSTNSNANSERSSW